MAEEYAGRDSACTACPLHLSAETVCVGGEGPLTSRVLVLGIAPGITEDRQGLPFQGKSGRLLRDVVKEMGLTVRYTNVVRCRPPSERKFHENRDPKAHELAACRRWLDEEAAAMPSLEVVVALGVVPIRALGVRKSVKAVAGVPVPVELAGRKVTMVAAWHPAAILRRPQLASAWEAQWYAVRRVVEGTVDRLSVETDGMFPAFEVFEDHFPPVPDAADRYVLDLETTGLSPGRDSITACSWSLPDGTTKAGMIRTPEDLRAVRDAFSRPGAHITVHNAPFEGGWAERFLGIPRWDSRVKVTDTRILSLRAEPGLPSSLETLTARHLPEWAGFKTETETLLQDVTWSEVPARALLRRNALDAFITGRLEGIFREKLSTEELAHHEEDVGIALSVGRMAARGLVLNRDEITLQQGEVQAVLERTEKAAEALTGFPLNLGSTKQLGEILGQLLPSELALPLTPSGQPCTDGTTLRLRRMEYEAEGMMEDPVYRLLGLVLEYREAEKVAGTYLRGYLKHIDGDGRVRADLWYPGTLSFRPASRDPNILNVPRGRTRSIVGTPPGYALVEADFGQMQLRVAAALSGDPLFCRNFKQGIDAHTDLARRAFGVEEPTKDHRYCAKTTNFGTLYGGQPKVLWEQFIGDGFPVRLPLVENLWRTFWREHTTLAFWIEDMKRRAEAGEPIFAPEGAHRWTLEQLLPLNAGRKDEALKSLVALVVSSVESRLTGRAICELERSHPWIEPVLHVYDAGVWYVPVEGLGEAVPAIRAAMERQGGTAGWWEGIPLPVDVKVGPDWGRAAKEI